MLDQTLLSGELEDLVDLEEAETFDVDGSALLIGLVVEVRVDGLDLVKLLELKSLHHHGGVRLIICIDSLHPKCCQHHSPCASP